MAAHAYVCGVRAQCVQGVRGRARAQLGGHGHGAAAGRGGGDGAGGRSRISGLGSRISRSVQLQSRLLQKETDALRTAHAKI